MKTLYAFVILFNLAFFSSNAQQRITLQKAIELTLDNNVQIKNAILNEQIGSEDLKQAKLNRLPDLIAHPIGSLNYGRNIDPSTNLYSTQQIIGLTGSLISQVIVSQGGLIKNQILQNKLLLEADKANTTKIKNDLTLVVITVFLQALTNQNLLKVATEQVAVINIALDKMRQKLDVGYNKPADISQLQAQLASAVLNKTQAQGQLNMSLLALKQLMELDPSTEINIIAPALNTIKNIDSQYIAANNLDEGIRINPDIHSVHIRKQIAFQEIKIAKSKYYPTIMIFGIIGSNYSNAQERPTGQQIALLPSGYLANDPSQTVISPFPFTTYEKYPLKSQLYDNLNEAVGVSLQIPIFNKLTVHTAVNKAKLNYQIAEHSEQSAKNSFIKTINQARVDLESSRAKYKAAKQNFEANKIGYDIIKKRFELGLVNSLDFNTSLTNLNKSEFEMIESEYEMIFKDKLVDFYMGKPINM